MRKIIEKSYCGLIFIFFALFTLLIRIDANDNLIIYCVGLLIASIFLAIIPFFINHCKKIEVRRTYLITLIIFSISVSLNSIYYLFADIIKSSDFAVSLMVWLIRISQALFIVSTLLTIFYAIKDLFKKGYSIQKFDLQAFQMVINLLTCITFYYVLFDYGQPEFILDIDDLATSESHFIITFYNNDIIKNVLLICSGIYIALYILLEVLKYIFFEKEDNKITRKFN